MEVDKILNDLKNEDVFTDYVLVISEQPTGFTMNTFEDVFKKKNINYVNASLLDIDLLDKIEDAFVVLFITGVSNSFELNRINSRCLELRKKVILYGDLSEIEVLKAGLDSRLIYKEFIKPKLLDVIAEEIDSFHKKVHRRRPQKRVLVVDDDGLMLRTIMGWIETKYTVALANSAVTAITSIQSSKPDLILLDYEMPVCSGAQFMEMLSMEDNTKDIPIIFLTSRSDAETVREVMRLKPKGYILKTTPPDKLIDMIEDYFFSVYPED